jgi:hypothetical protein
VAAVRLVRLVPVVRLIAFRLPRGALLNHDDGTSWWSQPRRWSIAVVGGGPGTTRELAPVVRERPLRRATRLASSAS